MSHPDLIQTFCWPRCTPAQVAAIHSWLSHLPDPPPLSGIHPVVEETQVFFPAIQSDAILNVSSPLTENKDEEWVSGWEDEERARRPRTKSFNLPRHCQTSSKVQTFIWGDTTHTKISCFSSSNVIHTLPAFSVSGFLFVINKANKTKIHFLRCPGKTKPYVMN